MSSRQLSWMLALSAFFLAPPLIADDPARHAPTRHGELYESLGEVIDRGARIFNDASDHAGCFRIYEGAILATRPFLPSDLKKQVDAGLAAAAGMASFYDKAFEMRRVLDVVRGRFQPAWYRLGGEDGALKIVEEFTAAVLTDPKIDFDRNGKFKVNMDSMKVEMVTLLSEVTGGPLRYRGPSMKEIHKGMKITNDEFDRTVNHMASALRKHRVPAPDISTILTAMETTRQDIVSAK